MKGLSQSANSPLGGSQPADTRTDKVGSKKRAPDLAPPPHHTSPPKKSKQESQQVGLNFLGTWMRFGTSRWMVFADDEDSVVEHYW